MREKKENENSELPCLHRGILQLNADGHRRWAAAVWAWPAEIEVFFGELQALLKGTLVLEWIQPSRGGDSVPPGFQSFDLIAYQSLGTESLIARELERRGFERVMTYGVSPEMLERLTVFQNEARRHGIEQVEDPKVLYRLQVHRASGELAARVGRACRRTERTLRGEVWGEKPGLFSKAFCDALRQEVQVEIPPNESGLATFSDLVVEESEGITWVEPMVFQALADFLGVVLQHRADVEVQWSLCEVDEQTGLAPPPLFRVRRRQRRWQVVPIGLKLVDQISLPRGEQEGRGVVRLYREILDSL